MGIYSDSVVKKSTAQASNTGAIVNTATNVASVIAGGVAMGAGGAIAGGASSVGGVVLGKSIKRMGGQMIGNAVGGNSGAVMASQITNAYDSYKYDSQLKDLTESEDRARFATRTEDLAQRDATRAGAKTRATTEALNERKEANLPADFLRQGMMDLGYSEKEFDRRQAKKEKETE